MNILNFLSVTEPQSKIFTQDNCPDNISSIFTFYEDFYKTFADTFEKPRLLLSVTNDLSKSSRFTTFKNEKYLIVELNQISSFSQFLELYFFYEIDRESDISFFFKNFLKNHSNYVEYLMPVKELTKPVRIKIEAKKNFKYSGIARNPLFKLIENVEGFDYFFEIIVGFVLMHEFGHHRILEKFNSTDSYIKNKINEMENRDFVFEDFIKKRSWFFTPTPEDKTRYTTFDKLDWKNLIYQIQLRNSENLMFSEELQSDYVALIHSYNLEGKWGTYTNTFFFYFSIISIFNNLILVQAKGKNINKESEIENLIYRKYIAIDNFIENFSPNNILKNIEGIVLLNLHMSFYTFFHICPEFYYFLQREIEMCKDFLPEFPMANATPIEIKTFIEELIKEHLNKNIYGQ